MPGDNNNDGSGPSASIMSFPQYTNFPRELRLKIIGEFVNGLDRRDVRVSDFAGVDSEWNSVIEPILFQTIKIEKEEVQNFARNCDKRQHLLHGVTLMLRLHASITGSASDLSDNAQIVERKVSEIFHVMKDWDRSETPHRPLTFFLGLPDTHCSDDNGFMNAFQIRTIACDFKELPEVAVIEKMFTIQPPDGLHFIDHPTMDSIHKKLPNLRSMALDLPTRMSVDNTIETARRRFIRSHHTKPELRMLNISQDPSLLHRPGHPSFIMRVREDEVTIAKALTPMIHLWAGTLASLRLDCTIDIPQFLSTASKMSWPNLKVMHLSAILDETEGQAHEDSDGLDSEKAYGAPQEALQGLIAALPFMRNLVVIDIQFRDPTSGLWACGLRVDLNEKRNPAGLLYNPPQAIIIKYLTKKIDQVPCRCGAITEEPTLVIRDFVLPGRLVTDLQDAIRQYRYHDLEAWCCRIHQLRLGRPTRTSLPCTRWNRDTGSWDFSFWNDMDDFIWQMGRFWLELSRWDFVTRADPEAFRDLLDREFEENFGP